MKLVYYSIAGLALVADAKKKGGKKKKPTTQNLPSFCSATIGYPGWKDGVYIGEFEEEDDGEDGPIDTTETPSMIDACQWEMFFGEFHESTTQDEKDLCKRHQECQKDSARSIVTAFWFSKFDKDYDNGLYYVKYKWASQRSAAIKANFVKQYTESYHEHSCMRFEEAGTTNRNWHSTSYIDVSNRVRACFAMNGETNYRGQPGYNNVNLHDTCFASGGTVPHELFHALGWIHEHQRPDRDSALKYFPQNVKRGKQSQFAKQKDSSASGTPFDCGSVMMYNKNGFSRDKRSPKYNTLKPLTKECNDKLTRLYENRQALRKHSPWDWYELNFQYFCPSKLMTLEVQDPKTKQMVPAYRWMEKMAKTDKESKKTFSKLQGYVFDQLDSQDCVSQLIADIAVELEVDPPKVCGGSSSGSSGSKPKPVPVKPVDPCAGVECGGGRCNNGACQCYSGYELQNNKCNRIDPCANVNCGDGGRCSNGRCACYGGFELVDNTCVSQFAGWKSSGRNYYKLSSSKVAKSGAAAACRSLNSRAYPARIRSSDELRAAQSALSGNQYGWVDGFMKYDLKWVGHKKAWVLSNGGFVHIDSWANDYPSKRFRPGNKHVNLDSRDGLRNDLRSTSSAYVVCELVN